VSAADELIENNLAYAEAFRNGDAPTTPARKLAVVTCMDARLNVYAALGLREGEAHVIRNAGGVITADGIRSLAISQRLLGTEEIMVIHHTGCGMLSFSDEEFAAELEGDTGFRPDWPAESFCDLEDDVRESIARIQASPGCQRHSPKSDPGRTPARSVDAPWQARGDRPNCPQAERGSVSSPTKI
jgi:carbonic anhydrase